MTTSVHVGANDGQSEGDSGSTSADTPHGAVLREADEFLKGQFEEFRDMFKAEMMAGTITALTDQ